MRRWPGAGLEACVLRSAVGQRLWLQTETCARFEKSRAVHRYDWGAMRLKRPWGTVLVLKDWFPAAAMREAALSLFLGVTPSKGREAPNSR